MSTPKEKPMSEAQKAQMEEQRRQSAALSQRARVAESALPSIIASFPSMSASEWVEKSVEVAELFLDKTWGIRFEKKVGETKKESV